MHFDWLFNWLQITYFTIMYLYKTSKSICRMYTDILGYFATFSNITYGKPWVHLKFRLKTRQNIKTNGTSECTTRRCCHQKLCHISLDWHYLWWIHRLYRRQHIKGKGFRISTLKGSSFKTLTNGEKKTRISFF
jgi:hypothetical protein